MKETDQLTPQEFDAIKSVAYEGAKEGVKENMKSRKRGMGIGGGILTRVLSKVILLVIALLPFALSRLNPFSNLASQISRDSVEDHDLTLENNGILGYTAADFAEVILGDTANLKNQELYLLWNCNLCN